MRFCSGISEKSCLNVVSSTYNVNEVIIIYWQVTVLAAIIILVWCSCSKNAIALTKRL